MGKWLNLVEDDALESFAWEKFFEFSGYSDKYDARQDFSGDPDFARIKIPGVGSAIKIDWFRFNYDHYFYYNDFFPLEYNEKNKKVNLKWNDAWYNSKEALENFDFEERNEIMILTDLIVSSLKEKNLDYKQYIKEFKQAYIKEFDLENKNNNRTKLVKKLFKAIDEKYLSKENESTDELSI